MRCNIDARGKRLRLIGGVVTIAAALIVMALLAGGALGPWWVWLIAAGALAGGAFQVFEARAGWCALRAMGIRTKV